MNAKSKSVSLNDFVGQLEAIEKQGNEIGAILRRWQLSPWDSVQGVTHNLRLILATYGKFASLRESAVAAQFKAVDIVWNVKTHINGTREINRHQGEGFYRSGAEGERRLRLGDNRLSVFMVGLDEYRQTYLAVNRWQRVIDGLNSYWDNWRKMSGNLDFLPPWSQIKTHCPIGGREVYSAILACQTGKTANRLPSEHALFGWHENRSDECRIVAKQLVAIRQSKGKAPSLKWGQELLRQNIHHNTDSPDYRVFASGEHTIRCEHDTTEPFQLRHNRNRIYHGGEPIFTSQNLWQSTFGSLNSSAQLQLLALRGTDNRKAHQRNLALCMVIMGVDNRSKIRSDVLTVITGRPERISGDTYYAAATWSRHDGNGYHLVSGVILLRAGWPDCYHLEGGTGLALPDGRMLRETGPKAIAQAKITGEWSTAREVDRIDYAIHERSDLTIALVDNACRSYFEVQNQVKAARLSSRQRQAQLFWSIRRINRPICLSDSYASGNCQVGTAQFVAQLGITTDCVEPRQLAKLWAKAAYPQIDRFSGVISRVMADTQAQPQLESAGTNVN